MTSVLQWGPVGSVMNLMTTELNALATATISAYGPEINNSSGYQQGQIYVNLASAAFVTGCYIGIYLVPSNDTAGTAYPTLGTAAQWAGASGNYWAASVYVNGTTAAQKEIVRDVRIPLGKFKTVVITGGACPTLGATLNTVDLYPTPTQGS